ncbi:heat shock 70kDa protein 8 [Trichonephila clavipes]|nr:heat shock 70kDa protein 8 [Trichonephila clavipes]
MSRSEAAPGILTKDHGILSLGRVTKPELTAILQTSAPRPYEDFEPNRFPMYQSQYTAGLQRHQHSKPQLDNAGHECEHEFQKKFEDSYPLDKEDLIKFMTAYDNKEVDNDEVEVICMLFLTVHSRTQQPMAYVPDLTRGTILNGTLSAPLYKELWFQQDGATCHTARATIDLLKDTFGDRLISRFGPVNWPPRSCDLTPLDYFLWGYVKSLVYADKPQTLDHLEDNIRRVIADIRPQMLEKVIENWTSRLDYIRASRGSPMPEIIFKILSPFLHPPALAGDQQFSIKEHLLLELNISKHAIEETDTSIKYILNGYKSDF